MPVSVGIDPGAIVTGVMQHRAQQMANHIAWANLMETKRQNRKREQLERADRSNVYGDTIRYTPGLGFHHILSGTTKNLLDAQRKEELSQLREDAPRNRDIARRKDKRARLAHEDYLQEYNRYKYRPQVTEGQYTADALRMMLESRKRANSEAANVLARQLMRTGGNKQAITQLYRDASTNYAESFRDALLRAKQLGRAEYRADRDYKDQKARDDLMFYLGIANDTSTVPVNFTNIGDVQTRRGDAAQQQLANAMAQSQQLSQRAYNQAVNTFGQSPSFRGAATIRGSFGGRSKGPTGQRITTVRNPTSQGGYTQEVTKVPITQGNQGSFWG